MLTNWLKVSRVQESKKCEINFDDFQKENSKLELYVDALRGISTNDKWRTWGREYLEVPVKVLKMFGILSNKPLTFYVNYVYFKEKHYCYSGSIFSGDAAWFDEYVERDSDRILKSESFLMAKAALENHKNKENFTDYFDAVKDKWSVVPIWNEEKAVIASALNTDIR